VVAYLVWLILFTVVEGAGRQACRMPTKKWIAAGADARDRTARTWFRDRAGECLDYTRWYRYSLAGLIGAGLAASLAAGWALRGKVARSALAAPIGLVAGVLLMLGTTMAVRWIYDRYA
jgi:hypothetical protein